MRQRLDHHGKRLQNSLRQSRDKLKGCVQDQREVVDESLAHLDNHLDQCRNQSGQSCRQPCCDGYDHLGGSLDQHGQIGKDAAHQRQHQLERTVGDLGQPRNQPVQNGEDDLTRALYNNGEIVDDRLTKRADNRSDDLQQFRHILHNRVQRFGKNLTDHIGHLPNIAVGIRDAFCKFSEEFNTRA